MQLGKLEFMKAVSGVAKMCGADVDEFMMELYSEAIEPHGFDKGIDALKRLAIKSRRMPTLADLLEIVAPHTVAEIEGGDDAATIVGLIEKALTRYGSQGGREGFAKQREMIGELGWTVFGSRWQHMCDTTQTEDLPTLKAQWRMEIKGAHARLKAGLPLAPGLPPGAEHVALPTAAHKAIAGLAAGMGLDRKSQAAGERVDEGGDPW